MESRRRIVQAAALLAAWPVIMLLLSACGSVTPQPPYDHIVIVVEENQDAEPVMANPYFTSLAGAGMSFTHFYGITHPSQPNYIALLSGSTHGIADDGHYDLTGPNLATSLLAAGYSFAGYSEGLPYTGFRGDVQGRYVRKHNPWATFANVPGASNLSFADFPTDFALLPTVSFVIPDLDHDMHDGTIAAAATWLQANLDNYASWAPQNNSLLVVMFDECSGGKPAYATPIATIMVGTHVPKGTSDQSVNLYSLLRMLEEMYSLPLVGEEQFTSRITGIWD